MITRADCKGLAARASEIVSLWKHGYTGLALLGIDEAFRVLEDLAVDFDLGNAEDKIAIQRLVDFGSTLLELRVAIESERRESV